MKKNFNVSIAVTITDEEVSLLTEEVLPLIDYIEFRVDLCSKHQLEYLSETVRSLQKAKKEIILTIRDPSEGGGKVYDPEEKLSIYKTLGQYAVMLDTEISSGLVSTLKNTLPEKVIIGSYHNFNSTPAYEYLEDIYRSAKKQGADIVKIATRADEKEELIVLTRFCVSHSSEAVVVAMGRYARASRVFFPLIGSLFSYASIGRPKAPGQLNIIELRSLVDAIMK